MTSRDHLTRGVSGGTLKPTHSLTHMTRGGRLPMGGPLCSRVYLAQLWRYGTSKLNTGKRTHARTRRWF